MVQVVFVDGPVAGRLVDMSVVPPTCAVQVAPAPAGLDPASLLSVKGMTVKYSRVPWSFDDGPAYAFLLDDPDAWRGPPAPNMIPDYPPDER